MQSLPNWARKPYHKKEVVASPRGWIVKETGEVLKMVKDLDRKLKDNGFPHIAEVKLPEVRILDDEPLQKSLEDMLYKREDVLDAPVEETKQETVESIVQVEESPVEDDLDEVIVEEKPKSRRGRRKTSN